MHPAVLPVAVLLLLLLAVLLQLLLLLLLLATHQPDSPKAVSRGNNESPRPPEWRWRKKRFKERAWPHWLRNPQITQGEVSSMLQAHPLTLLPMGSNVLHHVATCLLLQLCHVGCSSSFDYSDWHVCVHILGFRPRALYMGVGLSKSASAFYCSNPN